MNTISPQADPAIPDYKHKADAFLGVASQFRLGTIITEQPHPQTANLSALAESDLARAFEILKKIDVDALAVLGRNVDGIKRLSDKIRLVLESGNSVFLCGCGATGRLALSCETIWRRTHDGTPLADRVKAFMAGGDIALIRSIENFEDHPEYGARQLEELGFSEGDLLLGITEGGETPFVIGATMHAAAISKVKPVFMYCNPDDILCAVALRSEKIIRNPGIEKLNLTAGPMAVAGSTRMQASTVLMAAVGTALLNYDNPGRIVAEIELLRSFYSMLDVKFLECFTKQEYELYAAGRYLLYETDPELAIAILTDTTERSPTFSMIPFENAYDHNPPLSLSYVCLPGATDSVSAWNMLLCRAPRTLEWPQIGSVASKKRLDGFDLSSRVIERREKAAQPHTQVRFLVTSRSGIIKMSLGPCTFELETSRLSLLNQHLILKMILNMHSTLVMAKLGRFSGNIMTWVRPSNNKLIDRTIRYADHLLRQRGKPVSYEQLAYACFRLMETTSPDQSIVLAIVDSF